jgi:hypothetical protein
MLKIIIPQQHYPTIHDDGMDMYQIQIAQTIELVRAFIGTSKKLTLMSEYWCPEGFLHPKQQREFIPWLRKVMELHNVDSITIYTFSVFFLQNAEINEVFRETSQDFTPQDPSQIVLSVPLRGKTVTL